MENKLMTHFFPSSPSQFFIFTASLNSINNSAQNILYMNNETNDSNVSVTVYPIGTYQSGYACFSADTSSHNKIIAFILPNQRPIAGYIEIEWDASRYASGGNYYHLVAGEFSDTMKMILL